MLKAAKWLHGHLGGRTPVVVLSAALAAQPAGPDAGSGALCPPAPDAGPRRNGSLQAHGPHHAPVAASAQAGSGASAFAAEGDALLDALLSEGGDAPGVSEGGDGSGEAVSGAAEGSGSKAPGAPEVHISSELRKLDCHVSCHADQLINLVS